MSNTIGASLQNKFGLKKGDCFGLALPNLPEYPLLLLGGSEAGLIITTINPIYTPGQFTKFRGFVHTNSLARRFIVIHKPSGLLCLSCELLLALRASPIFLHQIIKIWTLKTMKNYKRKQILHLQKQQGRFAYVTCHYRNRMNFNPFIFESSKISKLDYGQFLRLERSNTISCRHRSLNSETLNFESFQNQTKV